MVRPNLNGLSKCFQPRQWFPHGFDSEGSERIMWVYRPNEANNGYLVGFFYPTGEWFTESAYSGDGAREKAAARVRWLSGGDV